MVRGLLARAAFCRHQEQWGAAKPDLQEAFEIAQRSEMRLHLTDYYLESAHLALAEGHNKSAAREHIDAAAKLIEETGYKRRLQELEGLGIM